MATVTADLLESCGVSKEMANKVATVIQTYFRKYLERKSRKKVLAEENFDYLEEESMSPGQIFVEHVLTSSEMDDQCEEAAKIIQNAYRTFIEKHQRDQKELFGMVDWRIAARSAINLYRRCGVSEMEANKAAVLIQAAYKGYYTRRVMNRLLEKGLSEDTVTTAEEDVYNDYFIDVAESEGTVASSMVSHDVQLDSHVEFDDQVTTLEVHEVSTKEAVILLQEASEFITETELLVGFDTESKPSTIMETVEEEMQDTHEEYGEEFEEGEEENIVEDLAVVEEVIEEFTTEVTDEASPTNNTEFVTEQTQSMTDDQMTEITATE